MSSYSHYCLAKATSSNGRDFLSCAEQCQSCRAKAQCNIDHSDPTAIPRFMCRVCGTPWDLLAPIAPAVEGAQAPHAPVDAPEPMRGYAPHAAAELLAWRDTEQGKSDATRAEVKAYYDQKRLCEYQQWAAEHPEQVKARRAARRASARAVARMGVKATGRAPRRTRRAKR